MRSFLAACCLLILSSQSFADEAHDMCRGFGAFDSALGVECISMLNKGEIQSDLVAVCKDAGRFDSQQGLKCVRVALNQKFDKMAALLCKQLGSFDSNQTINCLKTISGKIFSADEIKMCRDSGSFDSNKGISCLTKLGQSQLQLKCPTNDEIAKAVRVARTNLIAPPLDFSKGFNSIVQQIMQQVDRAAKADAILAAVEISLSYCTR